MTAAPPPVQGPFPPVPPPARSNVGLVAIAVAIVVVGVLATGAWLVSTVVNAPSASPTTSAPAVQAPASATGNATSTATYSEDDQAYLGTLARLPDFPITVYPQSALIAGGRGVCSDLATGVTPSGEMYGFAQKSGLSTNTAGEMVGAAIMAYCPQYRSAAGL